jgi:hypothetical protein
MINGVCFLNAGPDAVVALTQSVPIIGFPDYRRTSPRLQRVEDIAPFPDEFMPRSAGKRF